jgi:hypothetical protein
LSRWPLWGNAATTCEQSTMPKWQFWKKQSEVSPQIDHSEAPIVASRARGFVPPPPREGSSIEDTEGQADPALGRLIRRHEMLEREIEQAELAGIADNPWAARAAFLDQAIENIDKELLAPVERIDAPMPALPASPVEVEVLRAAAPSRVTLTIEGRKIEFEEAIDWAERGSTVVRSDLDVVDGDIAELASAFALTPDLSANLEMSLHSLATDARDRALEGLPTRSPFSVRDLLTRCPVCGDIALWHGVCLACEKRHAHRLQLEEERKQLFEARDGILKERETLLERLPMLRKRRAETAAAIEKMRVDRHVS